MKDIIVPIVFPDYKIALPFSSNTYNVSDLVPFIDVMPKKITVGNKVGNLGHAGLLFINGVTGVTKYYEYGRYDKDKLGWVRKVKYVPNVRINNNIMDENSFKRVLKFISSRSGHNGRISAGYILAENKYEDLLNYAQTKKMLNGYNRGLFLMSLFGYIRSKDGQRFVWKEDETAKNVIGRHSDAFGAQLWCDCELTTAKVAEMSSAEMQAEDKTDDRPSQAGFFLPWFQENMRSDDTEGDFNMGLLGLPCPSFVGIELRYPLSCLEKHAPYVMFLLHLEEG